MDDIEQLFGITADKPDTSEPTKPGAAMPATAPEGGAKDMPTYTGPVTPVPGSKPGAGKDLPATTDGDEPPTKPDEEPTKPTKPAQEPAKPVEAPDDIQRLFGISAAAPKEGAKPADGKPKDTGGFFKGLERGAFQGGVQQNLQTVADAAEMLAVSGDYEGAQKLSDYLNSVKKNLDAKGGKDMELQVPSVTDILGSGIGDTLSRLTTYLGEQTGMGLGSSAPSLLAGIGVGAAVSPEATPVVGVLAGLGTAGAVSYLQNAPQVYRGLIDAGMTDKKLAVKYAMIAGVPMAALDTVGERIPLLKGLGAEGLHTIQRAIYKRIAIDAAKGAASEGITETIQQVIQDATTSLAAGKEFWTKENLIGWADNFVGGAVGGGGMAGVSGIKPDKVKPAEGGQTETPPGAPPESQPQGGTGDQRPEAGTPGTTSATSDPDKSQANPTKPEGVSAGTPPAAGTAGTSTPGGHPLEAQPPATPAEPGTGEPEEEYVPEGQQPAARPAAQPANGKTDTTENAALNAQTQPAVTQPEGTPAAATPGGGPVPGAVDEAMAAAFRGLRGPQTTTTGAAAGPASVIATATQAGEAAKQQQAAQNAAQPAATPQPAPTGPVAQPVAKPAAEPQPAAGMVPRPAVAPVKTTVGGQPIGPRGQAAIQAQKDREAAVRAKQAAAPAAGEQITGDEALGGAGAGIVENMYVPLFKALQAGTTRTNTTKIGGKFVGGMEDDVLHDPRVKAAYENGEIQSPADLQKLVNQPGFVDSMPPIPPKDKMQPAARQPHVVAAERAEQARAAAPAPAPAPVEAPAGGEPKDIMSKWRASRKAAEAKRKTAKILTQAEKDAAAAKQAKAGKAEAAKKAVKTVAHTIAKAAETKTATIPVGNPAEKEAAAREAAKPAVEPAPVEKPAETTPVDDKTQRAKDKVAALLAKEAEIKAAAKAQPATPVEVAQKAKVQVESKRGRQKLGKVDRAGEIAAAVEKLRPGRIKEEAGDDRASGYAGLSAVQKEAIHQNMVKDVVSHIHSEAITEAMNTLHGEDDPGIAHSAADQALAEHLDDIKFELKPNSQGDPASRATVSQVIHKHLGPIVERARALTEVHAEAKVNAKAMDIVKGVQRARRIATAARFGKDEFGNKLTSKTAGQGKERTGKGKGKSARGTLAESDPRPWRERHEKQAEAGDERSIAIGQLYDKLRRLKGGDHWKGKKEYAQSIRDQLEEFWQEDKAELQPAAEVEKAKEEETFSPTHEAELIKKQAETERRNEEEAAKKEQQLQDEALAKKHAEHDRILQSVRKDNPEVPRKELMGRSSRVQMKLLSDQAKGLYEDLRQRIYGGKNLIIGSRVPKENRPKRTIPTKLDIRNSMAQNFLLQAKRIIGNSDQLYGDRLHDLVALTWEMHNAESPRAFYDQLHKAEEDFRINAKEYSAEPGFDEWLKSLEDERLSDQEGKILEEAKHDPAFEDKRTFLQKLRGAEVPFTEDLAGDLTPEDLAEIDAPTPTMVTPAGAPMNVTFTEGPHAVGKVELRTNRGYVSIDTANIKTVGELMKEKPEQSGLNRWEKAAGAVRGVLKRGGIHQYLRRFLDKRIMQMFHDVPVVMMGENEIRRLRGIPPGAGVARGMFALSSTEDIAKGGKGVVILNKDFIAREGGMEGGHPQQTLRHELTHAMTQYAVQHNIDGIRDTISSMINNLRYDLKKEGRPYIYDEPTDPEYQYGLSEADEFITEAYNNPAFQEFLASRDLPPYLRRVMGDHKLVGRGKLTYWDAFLSGVAKALKMSGFGKNGMNYLEAVIRLGEPALRTDNFLQSHAQDIMAGRINDAKYSSAIEIVSPSGNWERPGPQHLMGSIRAEEAQTTQPDPQALPFGSASSAQAVASAYQTMMEMKNSTGIGSRLRQQLNKMSTMAQLAQNTERWLGRDAMENGFHRILNAVRKAGFHAKTQMARGDAIVARMNSLPRHMQEALSKVMHDSTLNEVDPSQPLSGPNNAYISKKGILHTVKRVSHRVISRDFNNLSPEAQQIFRDAGEHYTKTQNEMTESLIKTLIAEGDAAKVLPERRQTTPEALKNWVMDGGIDRIGTDRESLEDKKMHELLGPLAHVFKDATSLRKIRGYYVNLMRQGMFAVSAKLKMVVPQGAMAIANDKFMFNSREALNAWAEQNKDHLARSIQSIWLLDNPVTGQVERVSPQEIRFHNGEEIKPVQHFVVSPQLEHFERFDSDREAMARSTELTNDPAYHHVSNAGLGQEFTRGGEYDILPPQQRALVEAATKHIADPDVRHQVGKQLASAIMRNNTGTRISNSRRKRKGVHGYNTDVIHALKSYNVSAANYIAKIEARPEINAGRAMIKKSIAERRYRDYPNTGEDVSHLKLQEAFLAVEEQLKANEQYNPGSPGSSWIQTALSVSFLDHLASTGNWIVNAMQGPVVTLPYLAARHGGWRAGMALTRAMRDIGSVRQFTTGVSNMLHPTNHKEMIMPMVAALRAKGFEQEAQMIERLREQGLISHDAGFELETNEIGKAMAAKLLSRASAVAGAVPTAMENINRASAAIAAYRLARQDGKTHEQSMNAGLDATNDTHGDYSQSVAALRFKSPQARLILQFKKYPQMMMRLLVKSVYDSFNGSTHKERVTARKQLIYLAMSHLAIAGIGGAPFTEIIKLLLMGAHGADPDVPDYQDFENSIQKFLSGFMSDKLSEVAMHGASRLFGADLSGRMGLDSLMFFGGPHNNAQGEYAKDNVKSWLLDTFAGAPLGLLGNIWSGLSDLGAGKYADAAHQFLIPKQLNDIVTAGNAYLGPKTKDSGLPDLGSQMSLTEAIWKSLGFQPARMSERWEYGGDKYQQIQKSNTGRAKHDRVQEWVSASPGKDRNDIWQSIREENKGKPAAERIKFEDLTKAAARRKTDLTKAKKEQAAYEKAHQ